MSRIHVLQATLLVATLLFVAIGAATIHPLTADAHRAPTIADGAAAPPDARALDPARKAPGGGNLKPTFFGNWWKKFKKIFRLVIDFIDGLIDNTKELMTEAGTQESWRPDHWSPTRPTFPDPQPQV